MDVNSNGQQFGQLRARLEATFFESTMIVVTSATHGDGKTATAFGLAQSLANADHRVLLVDANSTSPTLARIHRLPNLGGQIDLTKISRYSTKVAGERFDGVSLADERLAYGVSMEKLKVAVSDMRMHFDYIVVDTEPLIGSDLAVLFATIADGTLLTVRYGRLPTPADGETMKTLTRVNANVLGALTVSKQMIKTFAGQREELIRTIRVPARHVTSRHSTGPEPVSRETVESASSKSGS